MVAPVARQGGEKAQDSSMSVPVALHGGWAQKPVFSELFPMELLRLGTGA